jgi:hypothetical protein
MNTTSRAFFSWAQPMNARQARALIAAGVLGYEVVCKDGQSAKSVRGRVAGVEADSDARGDSSSGASSWQRHTGTV